MQMKLMILLLILMACTHCSKLEFDGFDPTTSVVKWIVTGEKK